MYLKRLFLQNFRSYDDVVFNFVPGANIIYGANAQGKTTLLEAIYLLITGRSFRASQISEMVRDGASSFFIEAHFDKHGVEQRLRFASDGKDRKVYYNNTLCSSLTGLLGILQGVLMTPDDLALVKGAPLGRRTFFDIQIAQVDPLYVHYLSRYHRAMRQRNCLLRSRELTTIENWEHELSQAAAYMTSQRVKTAQVLNARGVELYRTFSEGEGNFALTYKTSGSLEADINQLKEHYLAQYRKYRKKEVELGFTLIGPHKDDFMLSIANREARFFASEGQQRCCVAALRLAEWERMKSVTQGLPLLMIDDIGASLDTRRRDRLLQHISRLGQVFVTSTQEVTIPGDVIQCSIAIGDLDLIPK